MAEQIFAVQAGFFDSVNGDRLYSADQMNRPYRRLVSNGVFASPEGEASDDLQVLSSGGLGIVVKAGEGIFGNKWFENSADLAITIPANTDTVPRRDSVIAQVDTLSSGRVGNIVYRTGTPSSNPSAPDINQTTGVYEYRLANILIPAGGNSITQANITDMRGSADCPWITSLVNQVDTSTLFTQWETAYSNYFTEATAEWRQFLDNLTSELEVTTNVIMLSSMYQVTSQVSSVPINIASFSKDTDVLMVFINGLRAVENTHYTLASSGTSINLTTPLAAGNVVSFVVFHSVIAADIQTTLTAIAQLDAKIANVQGIPAAPTTDGTYVLRCVVDSGNVTYTWTQV